MSDAGNDRHIGLIGIGLVGTALAERWLAAGWSVVGSDLSDERRTEFAQRGGHAVASAREVVSAASVIVLSLPDSTVVERVLNEVRDQLTAGAVIIDTTTGDPDDAPRRARELAKRGVLYVDATLVGSSEQIRRGESVVLAGGDERAIAVCRTVFDSITRQLFAVGACGAGARMKLVVNLALGLQRAVLAEALALGQSSGFSLAQTLEVLRATPAYAACMESKGPKMVSGDFTPQARLAQHRKDVGLILQLAEQVHQPLPLSQTHAQLLDQAIALGWGESDNSAIFRIYKP